MIKWRFDKPEKKGIYLCWCVGENREVQYPLTIHWWAGWNALEPNSENEIDNVVAWAEIDPPNLSSTDPDTLPWYSQSEGD